MAKASERGARAWRHHGKFIFILMLLTAPSSIATRLHERGNRGGGGGRPVGLDEHSSNYLIDAKHAVEYGTRFTKTLVHHLEVHGVNAKHESRSDMYRLLDNVLDEMGSGADRDDDGGMQGEEPSKDDSRQGNGEGGSPARVNGQWKTSVNHETEREVQIARRRNLEAHSSHDTAAADINGPGIDHFEESLMHSRGGSFETCERVQGLLKDLANATNVGVKEGVEFMAKVESYVEEFTPCQTPTSSCLVMALRNDSTADAHECAPVTDLSSGTCEDVRELQKHVEKVIENYPGLGIIDTVRTVLGKIREDCEAVVAHGRRLAECPIDNPSGYYQLTEDCSLSFAISIPAGKNLTIVGIGNPTISRGEGGRHFNVEGRLDMIGVTLAKGSQSGGGAVYINNGAGTFTDCMFTRNTAQFEKEIGGVECGVGQGVEEMEVEKFLEKEVRFTSANGIMELRGGYMFENNDAGHIVNSGVSLAQILVGMLVVFAAAAYVVYDGIVGASEIESTGVLPFHTLSLRTITSYLQVASMLSLYKITFPALVTKMIAGQVAVSSPGEVITNIDCLGFAKMPIELFTSKQLIIFSAPLIMCAFLGVLFGVRSLLKRISGINQFIGSCLIGLNLMYPTLVRRAALIFTCRKIGKAQFLDEALDVECYQGAHIPLLLGLGVPSILLYVFGFPVALLIVLRRLTQTGALDPTSKAYNRRWVLRLGFLYAGYEKKYAYWEALVLLRKASLSGFAVLLSYRSTALQVVVALLILYLCHFAQTMAEPLEHDWHDLMESRSLAASLLILFACMIGDASSNRDGTLPEEVSIVVACAVLVVTCVFLISSIRLTLLGVVLESGNGGEDVEPSKFVILSKFILRTCCREEKDEEEWEKERQSFSMRSASATRDDQLKAKSTNPKLGDIEMVNNAMWTQNKDIEALKKGKKSEAPREEPSSENVDGGTAKKEEPQFKTYTDPATGRPYRYNPITQSTRWLNT
eukprot:g4580.t1